MRAAWWRERVPFLVILISAISAWLIVFAWRLNRELSPPPWENEITAFERKDLTNRPPDEAVLFVGSSTVAFWNTLRNDLPRFRVIRRGFGGAQMSDVVMYCSRIILPYKPVMVLVHAGGNDLAEGQTPENVANHFKKLVRRIHLENPEIRIGFISLKPSPARWTLVKQIREVNRLIETYTRTDSRLLFIDVFDLMLTESGSPRKELYDPDGLHLSPAGYKLWADAVRPHLPERARKSMEELVSGSSPANSPTNGPVGTLSSREVVRP